MLQLPSGGADRQGSTCNDVLTACASIGLPVIESCYKRQTDDGLEHGAYRLCGFRLLTLVVDRSPLTENYGRTIYIVNKRQILSQFRGR